MTRVALLSVAAPAAVILAACASSAPRQPSAPAAPAATWDADRARASADIRERYRALADAVRHKSLAAVRSFYASDAQLPQLTSMYRAMFIDPEWQHIDRFDIDLECIELSGSARDSATVVYTETSQARWTRKRTQHHRDESVRERARWVRGAAGWASASTERIDSTAHIVVDGNEVPPKASSLPLAPANASCK